MSLETLIAAGVFGWLVIGMVMMGLASGSTSIFEVPGSEDPRVVPEPQPREIAIRH